MEKKWQEYDQKFRSVVLTQTAPDIFADFGTVCGDFLKKLQETVDKIAKEKADKEKAEKEAKDKADKEAKEKEAKTKDAKKDKKEDAKPAEKKPEDKPEII